MPLRVGRLDVPMLLASLAIAVGLALIGWGLVVAVTGDERDPLPDAIESVSPAPHAQQVPQQAGFTVDLRSGYEGILSIDDVELRVVRLDELASVEAEPGQQIDLPPAAIYEPGNATISFTPSADAPVDKLESGRHSAKIVYWKTEEGRDAAATFTWEFEVV